MYRKREKGFKRIKIEDPYSESENYRIFNVFNFNFIKLFVIFIIILISCVVIVFIFSIPNKKKAFNTFNKNNNYKFKFKKKILNEINNEIYTEKRKDMKIQYEKYYENKNNKNIPKISLIVIINYNEDKYNVNIERLFNSIRNQTLKDIELIIMTDNDELNYGKTTSKDINIKIFKYKNNVGKLKKRLDGIYNSKGKYILFMDADDFFTSQDVLEKIYNQAIKDNIDILEFTSFHPLNCFASNPVYPPQLFDLMYFEKDEYLPTKQYHLVGKIISNKLLIYTLNTINISYIEENINLFDECMILLMIFQRASSFELLKIKGTNKVKRNNNNKNFLFYEEENLKDFLLYCKFLIQYTDDNVPEKRMSVKIFITYLVDKNYYIPPKYLDLLNDVIKLYLDCDKIGENEINRIKEYQKRNIIKK